jgi:ABC-type nitrate/sulfonate/bicarbonate transport system permease component
MKKVVIIVLPLVILLIWSIITQLDVVDSIFLPSPWAVVKSLVNGLISEGLFHDMCVTIYRSLSGFFIATLFGVPIGLLVGRIRLIANATQPTIDFFRSIPATALFPLFLFFFGVGDVAKIAISVYACSLIVLVNTAYGAMQVKQSRVSSARIMGASRLVIFWKIIVPESSPGIFAGLRVALSLSFVLIVVTEMFIGTTVGLGYEIMNAQMVYRTADMYAGIVLAGIIGYLANRSLMHLEKKLLHWVGQ